MTRLARAVAYCARDRQWIWYTDANGFAVYGSSDLAVVAKATGCSLGYLKSLIEDDDDDQYGEAADSGYRTAADNWDYTDAPAGKGGAA